MDYSTFTFELDCDAEGVVIDVASLYTRFERLSDKRHRRGLRYPLPLILVALVLGKLAGTTNRKGSPPGRSCAKICSVRLSV